MVALLRPRCRDLAARHQHDHLCAVRRRTGPGSAGRGQQTGPNRHQHPRLAELFYGAERSARPAANRLKVEQLVEAVEVLPITMGSAARFGVLKQQLVSRGRVKADIDLHIAAAAIEMGATLVTNDGALLAGDIEGLVAENWI